MAQEIRPWRPSTELSVMQQAAASKLALRDAISQQQAAEFGKLLIGQWPHASPPNPQAYSLSITTVLEQYPLGVVRECIDPVRGLARDREFPPTQKSVIEWCDRRVKRHQGAIIHGQIEAREKVEEVQFTPEHRKSMLQRWADLMHRLIDRQRVEAAE